MPLDILELFSLFVHERRHSWNGASLWKAWFVGRQIKNMLRHCLPKLVKEDIQQDELDFVILELNNNVFDKGRFITPKNSLYQRGENVVYKVVSFGAIDWKKLEEIIKALVDQRKIFQVETEDEVRNANRMAQFIESGKRLDYSIGDFLSKNEIDESERSKIGTKYRPVSWWELKDRPVEWLFIRGLSTKASSKRLGRALYEIRRVVEKKWGGKFEVSEQRTRFFTMTTFSVVFHSYFG